MQRPECCAVCCPEPGVEVNLTTKEKGRADAGAESRAGAEPDAAVSLA